MTKKLCMFTAVLTLVCVSGWANAAFQNPTPAIVAQEKGDEMPASGDVRGTCATATNLGMLVSGGGMWAGNNAGASDFNHAAEPNCVGSGYGGTGGDKVFQFTVDACGVWTFDTGCASPPGAPTCDLFFPCTDTSVRLGCGGACPGGNIACNGDACASYMSVVSKRLTAGTTYYMVVDSFNQSYDGPFTVTYSKAAAVCCTTSAACATAEGNFCNGQETCDGCTGTCVAGTPPCTGLTPVCIPGPAGSNTGTCVGCITNADCGDDGNFCTVFRRCAAGTCVTDPNPCRPYETCNEATDMCIPPNPCISWMSGTDVLTGNFSPQAFNTCRGGHGGDDIQLGPAAGRELISYQFIMQARNLAGNATCTATSGSPCFSEPAGSQYKATTSLWRVASGGACTPDTEIVGARCTNIAQANMTVKPGGSAGESVLCAPNAGLPTGVFLPDGDDDPILGQCGVDVYMLVVSPNDGAGFSIDRAEQRIGGPAMDDEFGQSVVVFEDCDAAFVPLGTYGFGAFSAPLISDMRGGRFCTVPEGPCCATDGTCSISQQDDCVAAMGTYLGDNTVYGIGNCSDATNDSDGDGSRDECDLCDADPLKTNPGLCGCGVSDVDTDQDGVEDCHDNCRLVANANQLNSDVTSDPPGDSLGDACDNCDFKANENQANADGDNHGDVCDICPGFNDALDADADGTPDGCDGCPNDPNKTEPLICGCGRPETGDSDGDGVSDCVDQCNGVDDALFAPGCVGQIPTVSEWGLIVLALLLLVAGKVYFGRRTVTA